MNAIEVRDVRKTYRRYGRRKSFGTLKSAILTGRVGRDLKADDAFEALKGVSFDVPAGKTFGIVGRNGSGKSTMLKLIAGIGRPTSGEVKVHGRVSALIELGAGFHPEISGRDNVFINGMMLGLSKREVASRFDEIVAFAELEDFIDEPVKTYSSGMYMRLGFSVAINVDPDVLLVDEVLAVGDEAFTHKCLDKFADFRRRGRTVLLVTHSLDMVTRFCDEALWLDHGLVRGQGDPRRVIDAYLLDVAAAENKALDRSRAVAAAPSAAQPEDMTKAVQGRWGSREAEIVSVEFVQSDGVTARVFESGVPLAIRMRVRALQPLQDFVFGVALFSAEGVCCYGTNTDIEGAEPHEFTGDAEVGFVIDSLCLVAGTYTVDVAVHRRNGVPFRLSSVALYDSSDLEAQRDRHRQTSTPVDVFERHPYLWPVRTSRFPILSRQQASAFAAGVRASGRRIVFTNGVFDLLHPGHVRYLSDARALGDALIVGVNSDRSVRANKGPTRPITPEGERAELIASLRSVDAVTVFDEDTPHALITAVQPDVLVKGADWGPDNIVGRDVVEARGGTVARIQLAEGFSSTRLIERVRGAEQ